MGAFDGALAILGGGSAPPPAADSNAAGLAYLNDPKNRAAVMADADRIAALRPGGGGTPSTQQTAPASPQPAQTAGAFDGALAILSGQSPQTAPAASNREIPYIDDSSNPNAKPGPGMRVEVAGTSKEPNLLEKAIGAGETALSLGTGIAAQIPGAIAAGSSILTNGKYGTQAGVDEAAKRFHEVSDAYTYEPRTDAGKNMLNTVGDAINRSGIVGLTPMAGEIGAAANPVRALVKDNIAARVMPAEPVAAAERIEPTMGGKQAGMPAAAPSPSASTANVGRGSVGAAGTDFVSQARAEGVPEPIIQKIAAQQGGEMNTTAIGRHIEAGSLPVPVDLTKGQATGDINILSHEQNMRGKAPELAARFNAQNGQIAANFDAIRDKVAPDVHVPAGHALDQAIVDAYKTMDEPVRADIQAKYQALADANGGDLPMSGKDFADAAHAALATESKAYANFLPGSVSKLIADYSSGEPMAFRDFESMRTILAREARKASASGDGNAAHAISIVRDALESLPMSEDAAHLKPLADAARAAAKARFDALGKDPAYRAAVEDGVNIGEPSPAADAFLRKYVVQGKNANVQKMLENLSSDPANQQLLAAGLIDHIKGQSGIDIRNGAGNVSQAGLNKALRNLNEKTGLVLGGDTAQTLEKLGNVARYTQEQPRGSYVNNSNTFVAQAADAAKDTIARVADNAAFGVPVGTWTKNALARRSFQKEVASSLEPGAGINHLTSALKKK